MPNPEVLPPQSPSEQALAAFSPTEAALAELEARAKETTYDLTTTAGEKIAREDRMQLVKLRTGVDAKRKEIKAPYLAAGAAVDERAKEITRRILAVEQPIDDLIKAREKEREDARIAREQAETARLKAQDAQLLAITMLPVGMVGRSAADIEQAIAQLQTAAHTWDEDYAERGATAIATTTGSLQGLLDAARQREEEAAKMAAERAENERIAAEARERAEQRERAAKARQDYINGIDRIPLDVDRDDAGKIHEAIEALRARDFDRDAPGTADDLQAITEARTRALSKLVSMHGAAIERAEERAREAADREQRQREQAERDAEQAARQAELDAQAEAQRAEAQRLADEQQQRDREAVERANAERERQEAEQAAAAQAAAEAHEAEIAWALELLDLGRSGDLTLVPPDAERIHALIRKLAGRQ